MANATVRVSPQRPQNFLPGAGYTRVQSSDAAGNNPVDYDPQMILRFTAFVKVANVPVTEFDPDGTPVLVTEVAPAEVTLTGDWLTDPIAVMATFLQGMADLGYLDLTGVANFPTS